MFYLPSPHTLWTLPKGGFYLPQAPNVSESVVALSEDSFPAKKKKKIDFLAKKSTLKPGGPLNVRLRGGSFDTTRT